MCGGESGEERWGLNEERRGCGTSRRNSVLIGRSWGKEGTQDERGFLVGGGDSQGDEEFLGSSNLGERLGLPFNEFKKTEAFSHLHSHRPSPAPREEAGLPLWDER